MKILVVSNMYPDKEHPNYGVFVKNFCNQLESLDFDFRISVLTKKHRKTGKILGYILFYVRTFFLCLNCKYTLVYIHYPSFSAAPVLFARKVRKFRIISNVHGTDVVPLKKEHKKMMNNTVRSIKMSDKVVVPSVYYENLVCEKFGINKDSVFVYPSAGIDTNIFYEYTKEKKEALRRSCNIQKDSFLVGFVSRINKAKGWDIFIDALEKINATNRKALSVIIVGNGEDDDYLSERIQLLPEEIRDAIIRFPLLPQDKLSEIYNMIDVFVFPTMSESESLGLVALEAMACGTPVIASDFAAPGYYVENGVNGTKFEKGDSNELSEYIQDYMNMTASELRKLSIGALKTAEGYSRKSIEAGLKELLE